MPHPHITPEDLYNIVSLSDPRFSPDGGRLAYVSTSIDRESNGYTSAICVVSVDAPSPDAPGTASGRPRQFTNGDKRDSAPRWSPCGRWLAFVSDRGDKKAKPQIYLIPTDGGEAHKLTEMENGASEPTWSPDGKQLA